MQYNRIRDITKRIGWLKFPKLFPLWKEKNWRIDTTIFPTIKIRNEKLSLLSRRVCSRNLRISLFSFVSNNLHVFYDRKNSYVHTWLHACKTILSACIEPGHDPPIIRKRLERTLQNVIASFSSFLISPRYFFPQRPSPFSQHVIPTTFAQNQVDIQSETKEHVYNNRIHTFLTGRSCQLVLPNGDHICCGNLISSIRYSIRLHPCIFQINRTIPYLKISTNTSYIPIYSFRAIQIPNFSLLVIRVIRFPSLLKIYGSRNILSCTKVVRSGVKLKKWKNNRIFDKRSCKDRSEKMIPLRTLKIQFGPLMSVEGTSSHSKRMCGGEKSFLGRWNSGG